MTHIKNEHKKVLNKIYLMLKSDKLSDEEIIDIMQMNKTNLHAIKEWKE